MLRTLYNLTDRSLPILALAIHNGSLLPDFVADNCLLSEEQRLREEDPYTEHFTEHFPNQIIVYTSRFAVDLNRSEVKAVYLTPEDCWGLNLRRTKFSEDELQTLYQAYQNWYAMLKHHVEYFLMRHNFLIVLDLHSYNHHRLGPGAPYDPQSDNPDIILGRNNMPPEYYALVEALRQQLDGTDLHGRKLDCRTDIKFSGGFLSRWLHNTFPNRVLCLAVEFKKIFMDEWSGVLDAEMFAALQSLFSDKVNAWLKDSLGFPDFAKSSHILWKS